MTQPVLEVRSIAKRFANTVALDGADVTCQPGEVHGLLGENGAGKSTLVKVLSGLVRPDSGSILVDGVEQRFRSAKTAQSIGLATAFQELTLVPHMTVAQNLLLGSARRRWLPMLDARISALGAQALDNWGASEINPDALVSDLTLGNRQRVEVVRALSRSPRILLLDEATAALSAPDVDWLFERVRQYTQAGGSTIYISHRMDEVRAICSSCTVLRNGRDVASFKTAEVGDAEIVAMMAGRAIEYLRQRPEATVSESTVLEAKGLVGRELDDVSFSVNRGEIVGVAGLQGHGQKELFDALFGVSRVKGDLTLRGESVRLRSSRKAIDNGIVMVPEDRKTEGLFLDHTGLFNVSLPSLREHSTAGVIRRRAERRAVGKALQRVQATPGAIDKEVRALSGGNQQKLAIGKWFTKNSDVVLLFDPTRGVDVETKVEIFAMMESWSAQGMGVLFYSTDLDELISVANRTLVMYRGRFVRELVGRESTKEAIIEAMLGGSMPEVVSR